MNFTGFSKEAIEFLINVKQNNSKKWFLESKPLYEKYLLKPFQNLIIDLTECMLEIDPAFEVMPFVNKTISRIHRDTRFAKDKTLYRNSMWIVFKKKTTKNYWRDLPAYFFEINTENYRYGMGFYCAKRETMDIFRVLLNEDQKEFQKVIEFNMNKFFEVGGDFYKHSFNDENPEEIKMWYDRKNLFIFHRSDNFEDIYQEKFVDELIKNFNILAPLYKFLSKIEERKSN